VLVSAWLGVPGSATAQGAPRHGHWVPGQSGPVLVCDLTYYAVGDHCLRPVAFARPAVRTDELPVAIARYVPSPRVSRRIVDVRGPDGRAWRVYLLIEGRSSTCFEVAVAKTYWGGLCFDGQGLVTSGTPATWILGERVLIGVASSEVDQVEVDLQTRRQRLDLSPDRGFIYFCRRRCACGLRKLTTYTHGSVSFTDDLRGFACS
jgi:hypothetical protein